MLNLVKALCWAAAMLFVALAKAYGLISIESAKTMLIVLPILAVLSLRGETRCSHPFHRGPAA